MLVFGEDLQRLAPSGLSLVVDVAQVQHDALHGPGAGQAAILHHAEVAMRLAVPFSRSSAETWKQRMPETKSKEKSVGLHSDHLQAFQHGRCCRQTKYRLAFWQKVSEPRKSGRRVWNFTAVIASHPGSACHILQHVKVLRRVSLVSGGLC